jgi:hypothetical protein
MTERARVWEPVPQVLEHVDQLVKAETSQCTGQGPSVQDWASLREGQSSPPKAAGVAMERVRLWEPAPQDLEHAVQEVKEDTSQSTGQESMLHCWVAALVGQALPP